MHRDPGKPKNYVIHVRKGYEDREESIRRQFSSLGLDFEWILDFDIVDLDSYTLEQYGYSGEHLNPAEISCSLKHIRAWERIATDEGAGGFVFEDDVLLDPAFHPVVNKALEEFGARFGEYGYISLGEGCSMFVPWTKRERGRSLYPAEQVRATDSYFLARGAAAAMVDWIRREGFSLPADHLINLLCHRLEIPILWLEPTVAIQGSHTGRFGSAIQPGDWRDLRRELRWLTKQVKIFRRKYIYPLLGRDERIMRPGLKRALRLGVGKDGGTP